MMQVSILGLNIEIYCIKERYTRNTNKQQDNCIFLSYFKGFHFFEKDDAPEKFLDAWEVFQPAVDECGKSDVKSPFKGGQVCAPVVGAYVGCSSEKDGWMTEAQMVYLSLLQISISNQYCSEI